MRNFIEIVSGTGNAERLDEMPGRRRGLQPGRDLRPEDTHGRITQAYGELQQRMGMGGPAGPATIDGDFADMDRPVIAGPPRGLPAPPAADEFERVDDIMPPPRPTGRAVTPVGPVIDMDEPAEPGTALAPVAPRGGALAAAADYEPRWMKVGDMPPMMRFAIQAQGAPLFSQFTDTPVQDIRILSSMTHSPHEVESLEANIRAEGEHQGNMDIHAFGMTSNVERYRWHGWDTLITRDPGGTHVFAWPETRRLGAPARGRGLPPPAPRRLR